MINLFSKRKKLIHLHQNYKEPISIKSPQETAPSVKAARVQRNFSPLNYIPHEAVSATSRPRRSERKSFYRVKTF